MSNLDSLSKLYPFLSKFQILRELEETTAVMQARASRPGPCNEPVAQLLRVWTKRIRASRGGLPLLEPLASVRIICLELLRPFTAGTSRF